MPDPSGPPASPGPSGPSGPSAPSPQVRLVSWDTHQRDLLHVRRIVFIDEQAVPEDEEIDGRDPDCAHALVTVDGAPVATGRLLPDGHIGRMAVLATQRGHGLVGLVLEALCAEARRRGHPLVVLAAQTHAIPFYGKHGFRVYGDVFDDAGIPHRWMDRAP